VSRFAEADKIVTATAKKPVQCTLCRILADLPKHEAAELRQLLAARSAPHMSRVLAAAGFTLGRSSIRNHTASHG
jgi:uncharacterized protein HemY